MPALQPRGDMSPRFRLIRFRSPLLTESIFLSFPPGTEMFQFPGLARVSRDQYSFDSFPELIAVFHALHRLLAPRHPPHALSSLAALIDPLTEQPGRLRGTARQTRKRSRSATILFVHSNRLCNEFDLRFSRRIQRILNFQQETFHPQKSLALFLRAGCLL